MSRASALPVPTAPLDAKRVFDVTVCSIGLVVLSPLLAAISVAVKVDTAGPVVFRQQRVGLDGALFRIHKFRTMRTGTNGTLISPEGDPRVTRVGAVLRRTKLDELPQLFDVVAGQMSLVGPRPEVPRYVALWPPDKRVIILGLRPGITDPASIQLRNEGQQLQDAADPEDLYIRSLLPRKVEMYVQYASSRTFFGDLGIIINTVIALIKK